MVMVTATPWDGWVDQALRRLSSTKLLRSLRPISLPCSPPSPADFRTFDGLRPWDRSSVEVEIDERTFHQWLLDLPSSGDMPLQDEEIDRNKKLKPYSWKMKKLLLFSGNDYLGLSSHPMVRTAAAKALEELGMGPRGSALICGYTNYHRLLESSLAKLKNKEECLLCPSGFAANMSLMVSIGSIASLLSESGKPNKDERIAIFSDALNHASIIDGIRLSERQREAHVFVYEHCDMARLDAMLLACPMQKRVVVTDGLFSMDGDFAPLPELVKLRRKHGFLLVVDDAHGTFVCGKNGGGVAELFSCESDIDICVGTLSKAAGCQGGFITCSKKWKQLLQSRGRSFIFSTAFPVPIAAGAYASVCVSREEMWRRQAIWDRVHDFSILTKIPITSPIISLVVGDEETALNASRHMLKSGFHVTAIRPPTVPHKACRLRVTLSAAHTFDDIERLVDALSHCIDLSAVNVNFNAMATDVMAKL